MDVFITCSAGRSSWARADRVFGFIILRALQRRVDDNNIVVRIIYDWEVSIYFVSHGSSDV